MRLLHERFGALRTALPHLALCDLPTPVRRLDALAHGREVWLKDDGRSAPRWGGNKPRKLEWTLADARRRGCGTVLTAGGLATNHGLATALHAGAHGIDTALVLVDQPVDEHVEAQLARLRASGATLHFAGTRRRANLLAPYLLARHAQLRPPRPPYWLPPGGSSPLGAVGFVEAGLELAAQVERGELPAPAAIVSALGTGGTAAGLLVGTRLAGLAPKVVAVLVNDQLPLSEASVLALARRTEALLRKAGDRHLPRAPLELRAGRDLQVVRGFLGPGYGHRTAAGDAATARARADDLALDPVYTAKATAALLAGADGAGPGPVLLWHTDGSVG